MEREDLVEHLREVLTLQDKKGMKKLFANAYLADLAQAFEEFEIDDVIKLLQMMTLKKQAKLFGYLSQNLQLQIVEIMEPSILKTLFAKMPSDERADLFNILPQEIRKKLLLNLTKAQQEDLKLLASYEEDVVGAIMTSDYAVLRVEMTANEAIESLRAVAHNSETIYQAYVVDESFKLLGTVSLRDLIVASGEQLVSEFMREDPIFIEADQPKEEVSNVIAKYDLLAVPVINEEQKLVGIVTYDDAMDVAAEEASEDFHKIGAMEAITENIKEAPIKVLYQKRVYWLVALVFANIFSGIAIAQYEDTIMSYVALVFFLPLLIASAGNAGAQSSTLMVRSLGTGDVGAKDWASMLGKELLVAGLLGLTMGLAVSAIGVWRGGPEIAAVVALTMLVIVIAGSLIGMSLPFLLSRLKLDPATASAPLVTSISDIVGVIIYFSIATAILF